MQVSKSQLNMFLENYSVSNTKIVKFYLAFFQKIN